MGSVAEQAHGDVVSFLTTHGAAVLDHPGGTLLAHLIRTSDLLASWGRAADLVLAGLCHAAYGTDGFQTQLIGLERRQALVDLIGGEAELIVYRYGSCDRSYLSTQPVDRQPPMMRDRFTGRVARPDDGEFRSFLDLTAANEFDLVREDPEFALQAGPAVAAHLAGMGQWLSQPALAAWADSYPDAGWGTSGDGGVWLS